MDSISLESCDPVNKADDRRFSQSTLLMAIYFLVKQVFGIHHLLGMGRTRVVCGRIGHPVSIAGFLAQQFVAEYKTTQVQPFFLTRTISSPPDSQPTSQTHGSPTQLRQTQ
jgi:hypothetical protein